MIRLALIVAGALRSWWWIACRALLPLLAATAAQAAAPTVSQSFSPATVAAGGNAVLTITLGNANALSTAILAFTDTLPASLTVSSGPATTCSGGTPLLTGSQLSMAAGTIPGAGSCTISLTVSSATPGGSTNTIAAGALSTASGSNASASSSTLTVVGQPVLATALSVATISPGQTLTATYTLQNPAGNASALTGVAFGSALPASPGQMRIAATPSASTSGCGSPVFAPVASATSLGFSGGTLAVGGTCTVSVRLTAPAVGSYTLSTTAPTATGPIALTGAASNAPLTVASPALQVSKTVTVSTDPINGSSYPKSIPGAEEYYVIAVSNTGAGPVDADSVVITEPIPSNMVLYVGNLTGGSGLTAAFADGGGGNASGLTLSGADITYSSNPGGGAPFTYTPTANGYDSRVTGIRIAPQGTFNGSAGAGVPSFSLTFKARLQ